MTRKRLPKDDRAPEEEGLVMPESTRVDVEGTIATGRDRGQLAAEIVLDPRSLVGSYFHRLENSEMVWGGHVVGEVGTDTFLCEISQGLEGTKRKTGAQVVIPLEQMVAKDLGYEWRFYNTADQQAAAFAEYVLQAGGEGGDEDGDD